MKLVRNVLPNSANLREVEVRTRLEGSDDQSVTLNLGARLRIAEHLRAERVAETSATPIRVEGVLRALHLDNNWLEITESDGKHVRFKTREDEVDDIIGPMVNRRVVAFGTKQKGDPFLLDIVAGSYGVINALRNRSAALRSYLRFERIGNHRSDANRSPHVNGKANP